MEASWCCKPLACQWNIPLALLPSTLPTSKPSDSLCLLLLFPPLPSTQEHSPFSVTQDDSIWVTSQLPRNPFFTTMSLSHADDKSFNWNSSHVLNVTGKILDGLPRAGTLFFHRPCLGTQGKSKIWNTWPAAAKTAEFIRSKKKVIVNWHTQKTKDRYNLKDMIKSSKCK